MPYYLVTIVPEALHLISIFHLFNQPILTTYLLDARQQLGSIYKIIYSIIYSLDSSII